MTCNLTDSITIISDTWEPLEILRVHALPADYVLDSPAMDSAPLDADELDGETPA